MTFQGARGSSAIDVSLVSRGLEGLRPTWHCGRKASHNDHQRIDITIRMESTVVRHMRRDVNKCVWPMYQSLVKGALPQEEYTRWSPSMIERAAEAFGKNLRRAIDIATPEAAVAQGMRYSWWTEELQVKKKEVRAAYHAARSAPDRLERYKEVKAEYARLIRKTKREKWQEFTSAANTIPLQAKLQRIITQEEVSLICQVLQTLQGIIIIILCSTDSSGVNERSTPL